MRPLVYGRVDKRESVLNSLVEIKRSRFSQLLYTVEMRLFLLLISDYNTESMIQLQHYSLYLFMHSCNGDAKRGEP